MDILLGYLRYSKKSYLDIQYPYQKIKEGIFTGYSNCTVGQKIKELRTAKGWTQAKLAKLSDCHRTYIGQLERGEKSATLESIKKIANALNVSLPALFENLNTGNSAAAENIPQKCYEFLLKKSREEQKQIFEILTAFDKHEQFKKNRKN